MELQDYFSTKSELTHPTFQSVKRFNLPISQKVWQTEPEWKNANSTDESTQKLFRGGIQFYISYTNSLGARVGAGPNPGMKAGSATAVLALGAALRTNAFIAGHARSPSCATTRSVVCVLLAHAATVHSGCRVVLNSILFAAEHTSLSQMRSWLGSIVSTPASLWCFS